MLTSLAYIFLLGLLMAVASKWLHLPRIIGMLITGIILGPCILNLLDPQVLAISADLRKMALVIILLKAGLTLNVQDLKEVGRPAILLSFLPALCEIAAFTFFAPMVMGIDTLDAAIAGAVLGAVSPAVVVPRMVTLIETGWGTEKRIPQMILGGASLDDVFVIVVFSTFTGMAQGGHVSVKSFLAIPVSIILGILMGAVFGYLLYLLFETSYQRKKPIRNSTKVIIVLAIAFLLLAIENALTGIAPVSGLLAIMSMASVIRIKCVPSVSSRLSQKFGKLWIAAEVILFVLVGAAVDIRYTLTAGLPAIAMIFIALFFRCQGVLLSLAGTPLNHKEKGFCVLSYLPKATVQAAIGSIPLAMGLPCGEMVLSVAVLSILITAPMGAIAMDAAYTSCLTQEESKKAA